MNNVSFHLPKLTTSEICKKATVVTMLAITSDCIPIPTNIFHHKVHHTIAIPVKTFHKITHRN